MSSSPAEDVHGVGTSLTLLTPQNRCLNVWDGRMGQDREREAGVCMMEGFRGRAAEAGGGLSPEADLGSLP